MLTALAALQVRYRSHGEPSLAFTAEGSRVPLASNTLRRKPLKMKEQSAMLPGDLGILGGKI
jgi:hypothetical protein